MYISDLDDNEVNVVCKFADDTDNGGMMDSEGGYLSLQNDFDELGKRIKEWQMEFNADKCKVIHFGKSNHSRTYIVSRVQDSVTEQREQWVNLHSSLKVAIQVDGVMKKLLGTSSFKG